MSRGRLSTAHTAFSFDAADIIMVGRESAGVPQEVHEAVDARVVVPMMPEARSLNVAVSAAIVLGEALRQTGQFDCAISAIANKG
jgi:tRNA (cytidine/uridine-2'-O-)-methyltransferase